VFLRISTRFFEEQTGGRSGLQPADNEQINEWL